MTKHVISIVVDNNANVMARVSSLFARRRFNMTSVTAAQTRSRHIHHHHRNGRRFSCS